jgi:hypothetical protein
MGEDGRTEMRSIQQTAVAEKLHRLRESNRLSREDQRKVLNFMDDNHDEADAEKIINRLKELTGDKTNRIDTASIPITHLQRNLFLETLLGDTQLFTELRALPPQQNSRVFLNYKDEDRINEFVQQWNSLLNVYFIPNLSDGKGGRKENIKQVTCYFCDFDVVKNYDGAYGYVMDRIDKFHYEPSALVHSGRGLHAYWFFKRPLDVYTQMIPFEWEGVQIGLAKHLGADIAVSDLNNPMRLPGTMNIKDKNNPLPCYVIWMTQNRYSANEFTSFYEVPGSIATGNDVEIDDKVIRETAELLAEMGFADSWEKAQTELKCFCPFHAEGKNPNLRFNIQKGLYHCVSCKAGGTAYSLRKKLIEIKRSGS